MAQTHLINSDERVTCLWIGQAKSAALHEGGNGGCLLLRKLHQAVYCQQENRRVARLEEVGDGREKAVRLPAGILRRDSPRQLLAASLSGLHLSSSLSPKALSQNSMVSCLQCKVLVLMNRGGASGPFMCRVPT